MSTIDKMIRDAVARGLVEMTLRPAVGPEWQAIAVYKDRRGGPWDVGCSPDLPTAIVRALNPPEIVPDEERQAAKQEDDGGIFG